MWTHGVVLLTHPRLPIAAWLLEADEAGSGGENGLRGYCAEACLLGLVVGGEGGAGGSSSAIETPRARSLAS